MIYVKQLRDKHSSESFILFTHGEYKNPLRIMNRNEIFLLKKEIEAALEEVFFPAELTKED